MSTALALMLASCGRLAYDEIAIAPQELMPTGCVDLPLRSGPTVVVSGGDVAGLRERLATVREGTTVLLESGTYDLSSGPLRIETDNVSLRGMRGARDSVVLDAGFVGGGVLIRSSGVTVADLTIVRSVSGGNESSIEITGSETANTQQTLLYNLSLLDHKATGVSIHSTTDGFYSDDGVLACSTIEKTNQDDCASAIIATELRGWRFADNTVSGHHCETGEASGFTIFEAARDLTIERNRFIDNNLDLLLGLRTSADSVRTYVDQPCSEFGYVDYIGGTVRNNVFTTSSLVAIQDVAIALWNACETQVVHNTIRFEPGGSPFASIEWRFQGPEVMVVNNLMTDETRARDGATIATELNLRPADAALVFNRDFPGFRLLDNESNAAIDSAVMLPARVCDDDIDGDVRTGDRDFGADEL